MRTGAVKLAVGAVLTFCLALGGAPAKALALPLKWSNPKNCALKLASDIAVSTRVEDRGGSGTWWVTGVEFYPVGVGDHVGITRLSGQITDLTTGTYKGKVDIFPKDATRGMFTVKRVDDKQGEGTRRNHSLKVEWTVYAPGAFVRRQCTVVNTFGKL